MPSAGGQTQGCSGLEQSKATWEGGQSSCSHPWVFAYTTPPAQHIPSPALWSTLFTSSRKPSLTFHFVRSPFCYPRPSLTMQGVLFGCCGCVRSSFSGSQHLAQSQAHGRAGGHGLEVPTASGQPWSEEAIWRRTRDSGRQRRTEAKSRALGSGGGGWGRAAEGSGPQTLSIPQCPLSAGHGSLLSTLVSIRPGLQTTILGLGEPHDLKCHMRIRAGHAQASGPPAWGCVNPFQPRGPAEMRWAGDTLVSRAQDQQGHETWGPRTEPGTRTCTADAR